MKKKLQLCYGLIAAGMLLCANDVKAQVSYSTSFDEDESGWLVDTFEYSTESPCTGAGSLAANLWFFVPDGQMISPSTGISEGGQVTLTFNYKVLDYETLTATPNEWGFIEVYYATSPEGPFTLLQTIDASSHEESTDCSEQTVIFYPPAGEEVYIGIYAAATNDEGDFIVFFDDVNVSEVPLEACTGTPGATAAVVSNSVLCIDAEATVSLEPIYRETGLTFQWQASADGVTFTNIEGATEPTYSFTQDANTFYRATITCTAAGDTVTSEAVEVVNNGFVCICDVSFSNGTEPITRVEFAGIDNASSNDPDTLDDMEDFRGLTPGEVTQGESYPITLEGNTVGNFRNYFTVYIDFNQNGDFTDAGESFQIGMLTNSDGTDGQQVTGTIAIPPDAAIGNTSMRVFKLYNLYTDAPCETEDGFDYGQVEDYLINVSAPVAGAGEFTSANFKYYPNPVTNVLNVSYVKNITGVEVFNLVGQKVINKTVNQNDAQVDMSALSTGTYMVKVSSAEGSKTIKVIKQ